VKLRLRLNEYQLTALGDGPLDDLLARAVAFDAAREPEPRLQRPRRRGAPPIERPRGAVVEPGTALSVELAAGETLRIEQLTDGQCADLNAFALDETRRPLSAAITRMREGIHPTTGAALWSAPPVAPLLTIVADTHGEHDLAFPMCSVDEYGIAGHPNCFDIQRDAQRSLGLTPHDPLNLWLPSQVDSDGRLRSWPVACRRGDHVELRAETDVLAVVNPCPDDLFGSSQYEPGPVLVNAPREGRTTGSPLATRWQEIDVSLPGHLAAHLSDVRQRGWLGTSDASVARALLLRWWEAQSAGSSQIAAQRQPTSQRSPTASE
jgi:uncharacterized protein